MDNVVPYCNRCNRAKDTMFQQEYLDLARAIVKIHGG